MRKNEGLAATREETWQPMSTAPRDRAILVYGRPTDIDGVRFLEAGVHAAYWDNIDSAFCLKGATWLGPFIYPTHWMDEPEKPAPRFDDNGTAIAAAAGG